MVVIVNPNHPWDKNVDFAREFPRLRDDLRSAKFESDRDRVKLCILIIALRNGSRIYEAKDAYNKFAKAPAIDIKIERKEGREYQVSVVVEKRGFKRKFKTNKNGGRVYLIDEKTGKKRPVTLSVERKPFNRLMQIPNFIPIGLGEYKKTCENLCMFAEKYYKWNPHALRYAFITHESETTSPQLIAKMTGHTTMDMILEYTQQNKANKRLIEIGQEAEKLR